MSKQKNYTLPVLIGIFLIFTASYLFLPAYLYNRGKSYINQKDYVNAYSYLKKAVSLKNNNSNYRYYYVVALSNLSPTVTVQKELFNISESKLEDSAQQAAKTKINEWRFNVMRNIGDNYIEQAPMENKIVRWDNSQLPIRVAITNNSGDTVPDYYITEINRAFAQWQASTGFLKFEINDKRPNILVKIIPIPSNICKEGECRYIVGYTEPQYNGKILRTMTITLYSKDPYGNYFSDKELYNTILHEIGHAMGIMGHSYSSEDIMYMSTNGQEHIYAQYRSSFQYLSSKDINTIRLLYKLIPDITNSETIDTKGLVYAPIILGTSKEITERKLKEAKNYVKNAPDMSMGYVDMGIAYVDLNKYKDAIKAFSKAYELSKTDNEKYISAYNLSITYLNSNDITNALVYAQIAQRISDTDEIKELLMNINHAKNH